MKENEEVQEIKQKIILCAIVFVFVLVLGLFLVFNRFGSDVDAVTEALNKKETFVLFFNNDSDLCQDCSMVEDTLNELGVSYYTFNVQAPSYDSVLRRLQVDYEVVVPAVYVVVKGEVRYNITNVNSKKTVENFIKNNHILSLLEE